MERFASAIRRVVTRARTSYYARNYNRLHPRDYTRAEFRAKAEEACALLCEANRRLPPLPEDAFQPYWMENLRRFRERLEQPLPETFLSLPELLETMVRRGWSSDQEHELVAVRDALARKEEMRKPFEESRVGGPHLECRPLKCSTSTLGYLYYVSRILQFREQARQDCPPHSVIELGGGYGGFCRVYDWAMAPRQYTIIDLVEYSSVQYLFLSLSMDARRVKFLTDEKDSLLEDGINLCPVNLFLSGKVVPRGAFFVSTFALTESGAAIRKAVYRAGFFGAGEVYYVGQTSARWPVSVDPEVLSALSEDDRWRACRVPFYLPECVELYAAQFGPARTGIDPRRGAGS